MKRNIKLGHITPAGAKKLAIKESLMTELAVWSEEKALKRTMQVLELGAAPPKVSTFVREAVARMQAAPRFLSQEAWDDSASYELTGGPVVSGAPEGLVPENLEDDDDE
jgi:hypothetical protein